MRGKRGRRHGLIERVQWIGSVLAVLAIDCAGFRLEDGFGIGQALESIALQLYCPLQVLSGDGEVIGR